MVARSIIALSFAVVVAQAIQITFPSNSSGWNTHGSQMIKWKSVSTDPSNFTIAISQPGSSMNEDIKTDVMTSDGSYVYTPAKDLEAGEGYRISFTSQDGGILAQSNYFSITQGTSTVTPTNATAASSTASTSAASTTMPVTGTAGASTTAKPSSGAKMASVSGLLLLAAGALAMLS
ncbi:uncharacterized protein L203_106139 [Cryptococcus depauperatus CBS 7841]|uniref:Yeast cell wall synthesis Kre9/Knh1-like N-terminal domain-containing protein n=1 Tax=Cryptococcus depauperatus CBS 7841 TaxID=1295531 RepID=A0AAJ8JYZ6_9TREE